jgi:hypothetical protein
VFDYQDVFDYIELFYKADSICKCNG